MNRAFKSASIALFIFLSLAILLVSQRRNISDWYKLSNYNAPSSISSLATQDTFTPYAKKLFYINQPVLISGAEFRNKCPNSDPTSSEILGCYHPIMNGIYLYIVNEPTLNGVEQVTAAHEMLHAAWARLGSADKEKLTKELNDFYNNDLTDPTVKKEIAIYQKTEPGFVADEMNSTFSTECASLTPSLENYYKSLFVNRQAVVSFSNGYKQVFKNYQNQIKSDDAQLNSLKITINNNISNITSQLSSIKALRAQMDNLLSSGSIDKYNQDVLVYNQQIQGYNSLISQTQSLISQYNSLVATRNSTAAIFDSLSEKLNSNLSALPTK